MSFTLSNKEGVLFVELKESLTQDRLPYFAVHLIQEIEKRNEQSIALLMSNQTQLDAGGVSFILHLFKDLQEKNRPIALVDCQEPIRSLLQLCKLDQILTQIRTPDEAIDFLR